MPTEDKRHRSDHAASVLEVKNPRHIGPAEAAVMLAECLALTRKNLEAALWQAIEELDAIQPVGERTGPVAAIALADAGFRAAITAHRRDFFPQFIATWQAGFQQRLQGKSRDALWSKQETTELALVEHDALGEQVALKKAIRGMRETVREEKFALDLRVRLLLRETADAAIFDNPWDCTYFFDALGTTCRGLWREADRWRPVMERTVILATPSMLTLYRELNGYLKDCDIAPLMRVRLRSRTGTLHSGPQRTADVFSMLMRHNASRIGAGAVQGAQSLPGTPVYPASWGNAQDASAPHPSAPADPAALMQAVMAALSTGLVGAPFSSLPPGSWTAAEGAQAAYHPHWAPIGSGQQSPDAGRSPSGLTGQAPSRMGGQLLGSPLTNQIRIAQRALAGYIHNPTDHAVIEIAAGVTDYVLEDPHSPVAVKALLGRLQIPLLKAVLLDHDVLADADHPVRSFLDTLAKAMTGLRDGDPQSQEMLALAERLTGRILDEFHDDVSVFESAKRELDDYLDPQRAALNQRVAEATPALLAAEAQAIAREEAQERVATRMSGWRVPQVVHSFLSNEWLDHLSAVYLEHGAESAQWREELALIEDLLWSLDPQARLDPSRLRHLLPELVRAFAGGQRVELVTEPRRKAMLDSMFALHMSAVRSTAATPVVAEPQLSVAPFAAMQQDADDDQVIALSRGDWCEFRGADGQDPVLARLAWRSPHRTQLLFTHRDGSTAFMHTPLSLAEAFRAGRVLVVVEDVPLCERALRHLLDQTPPRGVA